VSGTVTLRKTPLVLVAVVMAWLAGPAARADIQFSIRDGRVVLVATNASIADIMAEWAKVGHTKIVNSDKIPRDVVVTLELRNVSERQALDILLRSTSGFIAALREQDDPNASLFDRIVIMPPSAAPPPPPPVNASAPQYPRAPAPAAPPVEQPQPPQLQAAADANDRSDEPPAPILVGSAVQTEPLPSFQSNSRHMMETVDPRNFRLPPGMSGAVMVPPATAVPPVMGSSRPGVISMPAAPNAR